MRSLMIRCDLHVNIYRFERVVHSVLTVRILLDLRKLGRYGNNSTTEETLDPGVSIEQVVFARRQKESLSGF